MCYAHGIHLAVMDVLKLKSLHTEISSSEILFQDEIDDEDAEEPDDEDGLQFHVTSEPPFLYTNTFKIDEIIGKVREVVKLFKKSPTRTDVSLNPIMKEMLGKTKTLFLDCKTRWGSTAIMLERFLELYEAKIIEHALIDVGSSIRFSEQDVGCLKTLLNCLKPCKDAVEILCKRETDLLKADSILACLLNHIDLDTELGRLLNNALILRINERRSESSKALQILHNRGQTPLHNSFGKMTRPEFKVFIEALCSRWEEQSPAEINTSTSDMESSFDVSYPGPDNFIALAQAAINRDCKTSKATSKEDCVETELVLFLSTGTRGPILNRCYDSLKTIQATSAEAERSFSAAGNMVTKLRSRLGDDAISALSMMRHYFLSLQKKK